MIGDLIPTEDFESLAYSIHVVSSLQILHANKPGNWVAAACSESDRGSNVNIYDSVFDFPAKTIPEQVASLQRTSSASFTLTMRWCPKQEAENSCGLHALANLTELASNPTAFKKCTWKWDEGKLAEHFRQCIDDNQIRTFPKRELLSSTRKGLQQGKRFKYSAFCICRQPNIIGSLFSSHIGTNIPWIQCCGPKCKRWFHRRCVDVDDERESFTCPVCLPTKVGYYNWHTRKCSNVWFFLRFLTLYKLYIS